MPKKEISKTARVVTFTWACNKKSNRTYRDRFNVQGFENKYGAHYDSTSISVPVKNNATIYICLILMIMTGWAGQLCDVKGEFLYGEFEYSEEIYMRIT